MQITFDGTIDEIKQQMRVFLDEKTAPTVVLKAKGEAVTKEASKASEKPPQAAEQPKKKASKAKKKANGAAEEAEALAEAGAEAEIIDRTMIREKCAELIAEKGKDVLQTILSNLGCRTFGDVKEEQLVPLLKQVEAEL